MSAGDGFPRVAVCGHVLTVCRMADVRGMLARAIAGSDAPIALATLNLDFLRLADESPPLHAALAAFTHRFADGWPVVELARRAGTVLPERVTGSDLTPMICGWARESGWKLAFVGGSPACEAALAQRMPRDFPGVLAGHWTPSYRAGADLRDPGLTAAIRASGAQVLLVALGCPKQEFWIRDNLVASGARVAIGVGASLDFLAGTQRRAPRMWQRLRLEFLYRLLREPLRLGGRYWRDFWFYRRAKRQSAQRDA
ncbi:MAG TPA: WecB/TagA/CpsF family glycosyltransferase [Planctomycetota bacterium]|nr:WecB/TagA/CpsF family glycosyltransferase [Planctomycetota bacterium]